MTVVYPFLLILYKYIPLGKISYISIPEPEFPGESSSLSAHGLPGSIGG
jgi:hypothetical protein